MRLTKFLSLLTLISIFCINITSAVDYSSDKLPDCSGGDRWSNCHEELCQAIVDERYVKSKIGLVFSVGLFKTAEQQALSMLRNYPDCDLSSWPPGIDNGNGEALWTECCVPNPISKPSDAPACMLSKPSEITKKWGTLAYTSNAYNVGFRFASEGFNLSYVAQVLAAYSPLILNGGEFESKAFETIGCAWVDPVAFVWYGEGLDPIAYTEGPMPIFYEEDLTFTYVGAGVGGGLCCICLIIFVIACIYLCEDDEEERRSARMNGHGHGQPNDRRRNESRSRRRSTEVMMMPALQPNGPAVPGTPWSLPQGPQMPTMHSDASQQQGFYSPKPSMMDIHSTTSDSPRHYGPAMAIKGGMSEAGGSIYAPASHRNFEDSGEIYTAADHRSDASGARAIDTLKAFNEAGGMYGDMPLRPKGQETDVVIPNGGHGGPAGGGPQYHDNLGMGPMGGGEDMVLVDDSSIMCPNCGNSAWNRSNETPNLAQCGVCGIDAPKSSASAIPAPRRGGPI